MFLKSAQCKLTVHKSQAYWETETLKQICVQVLEQQNRRNEIPAFYNFTGVVL